MTNELSTALDSLTTQVSTSINLTDVIGVYGKAIGASILIFLGVWGGRKILQYVKSAMNGKLRTR